MLVSRNEARPTDSAGAFAFTGLPPGSHLVRTQRVGYETHTDTVTLDGDAGVELDVTIRQAIIDRCFEMLVVRTRLPWWHVW